LIDVSTKAAHLLDFHNRGTAWVRVDYVGHAPMEGSDDRILAATLRQDEPAPPPDSIKLAATPLVPATWTPPASRDRFASAASSDASPETTGSQPMSYAGQPSGRDGTDQFLNGRGLY